MSKNARVDLPFIKFYTGEYRRVTVGLTPAEKGAFMELVIFQWDRAKCPPDDDTTLSRIVGCSVQEWRRMKPALIEAGFDVDDGAWRNRLFEYHRDKAEELRRRNVERARKAANARYANERA